MNQRFNRAEPENVTDIEDCSFYHTMDIPGYGIVDGVWDLRGRESAYLGNVTLAGKRVLEIGTASGHLCFTMEKMGASVVGYDLSDKQDWDNVPYYGFDEAKLIVEQKECFRRVRNGYWLAHRAFNSSAKMVYGSVYEIPDNIGTFDVCTFGSILLHLRDPFLALQRGSSHAKEMVIVTDTCGRIGIRAFAYRLLDIIEGVTGARLIRFLPTAKNHSPTDTWWMLTPRLVSEMLHILGFPHTTISFHRQSQKAGEILLFTVVGKR